MFFIVFSLGSRPLQTFFLSPKRKSKSATLSYLQTGFYSGSCEVWGRTIIAEVTLLLCRGPFWNYRKNLTLTTSTQRWRHDQENKFSSPLFRQQKTLEATSGESGFSRDTECNMLTKMSPKPSSPTDWAATCPPSTCFCCGGQPLRVKMISAPFQGKPFQCLHMWWHHQGWCIYRVLLRLLKQLPRSASTVKTHMKRLNYRQHSFTSHCWLRNSYV